MDLRWFAVAGVVALGLLAVSREMEPVQMRAVAHAPVAKVASDNFVTMQGVGGSSVGTSAADVSTSSTNVVSTSGVVQVCAPNVTGWCYSPLCTSPNSGCRVVTAAGPSG